MDEEEAWFQAWVRSPLAFDWPMPHVMPHEGALPDHTTPPTNKVSTDAIKIDPVSDDECTPTTILPQEALPAPSRSNKPTPTEPAKVIAPPQRMVLRSAAKKCERK